MNTLERVQKVMVEKRLVDANKVSDPSVSLGDLGMDSLALSELLFDLEDEFKIKTGDQLPVVQTLQDIVEYVDKLLLQHSSQQ